MASQRRQLGAEPQEAGSSPGRWGVGRGLLAEGTHVKEWRCEQSTAVLEDLSSVAGMSSCFPYDPAIHHCRRGLEVPTFLLAFPFSLEGSFHQPSMIGFPLCVRHWAGYWGTRDEGGRHGACFPGALSRMMSKQVLSTS